MPRRPRLAAGDLAYHVLNRRVGRLPLFETPADYTAFEKILAEAHAQTKIRIAAYCLMPNHWHLLLWPRQDGELSEILRWITVTHTQRWHAHHHTAGTGPVYQGRFKSFPVQTNEHFLTVARYVERNALRAKLVTQAEGWQWSSLWRRDQGDNTLTTWLSDWPVERPRDWLARVNRPQTASELESLRVSVQRGRPFGRNKRGRESFLDTTTTVSLQDSPCHAAVDLAYHVLNRRVGRLPLFEKPADYAAFEQILAEAHAQTKIRIAAYCLMPNHWHLLLWPRQDGELSEILRWMTVTHTQRWHAHHHTAGTGPVYQGRFKSFPVQTNEHFLTVARYVERNALRAKLVTQAEGWQWSSLWRRDQGDNTLTTWLSDWPVERPRDWLARVNRPQTASELESLRVSVQRGRPFGEEAWVQRMAKRFGMESTLRPRGRPKGS